MARQRRYIITDNVMFAVRPDGLGVTEDISEDEEMEYWLE